MHESAPTINPNLRIPRESTIIPIQKFESRFLHISAQQLNRKSLLLHRVLPAFRISTGQHDKHPLRGMKSTRRASNPHSIEGDVLEARCIVCSDLEHKFEAGRGPCVDARPRP